jgi:hypothetical protein
MRSMVTERSDCRHHDNPRHMMTMRSSSMNRFNQIRYTLRNRAQSQHQTLGHTFHVLVSSPSSWRSRDSPHARISAQRPRATPSAVPPALFTTPPFPASSLRPHAPVLRSHFPPRLTAHGVTLPVRRLQPRPSDAGLAYATKLQASVFDSPAERRAATVPDRHHQLSGFELCERGHCARRSAAI